MNYKSNKSPKKNSVFVISKLLPIIVLILLGALYFLPEFSGDKIMGSDRIQSRSVNNARLIYQNEANFDDFVIWNPGIFAGTSSLYAGVSKFNLYHLLTDTFVDIFKSKGALIFIISLLISYFFARKMGFPILLSLLLAITITFPVNNIILYKEGHVSKIFTLVFIPLLLWGFYELFENKKLLTGGIFLVLGVGFSLYTRHPQMSYYLFLSMIPFLGIELFYLIKNKEFKYLSKIIIVGIASLLLGVGGNADRIWNMQDHLKISMRGDKYVKPVEIENSTEKKSSGLDWEYAMMWSNTLPDMMTAIIPGFAGGSHSEKLSEESDIYKKYNIKSAPLYWKDFPISIAPSYLGVISIFLFFLSLVFYRNKWTIGLSLAILLTVLLSFGSNLAWFQRLFFDYIPLYNKFRAPQSIIGVTTFIIPFVSMYFLYRIKDEEKSKTFNKKVLYAILVFIGFMIFAVFILPSFYDFSGPIDERLSAQGANIGDFINARKELLASDGKRSIFLVLLSGILIYLYLIDKLKYNILVVGLLILTSFDLLTINARYYNWDLYDDHIKIESYYQPRNVDLQILNLEKNREDYRVLDLSINTFNSGSSSYFHNTIGGYSPLKHRRFQDIRERYMTKFNMGILNMLNTKYFIQQDGTLAQNPDANGIAWFVNSIKYVDTQDEEIKEIGSMDVKNEVILASNYKEKLANISPSKEAINTVKYISYHPDRIEYEVNSSTNNLVVFSEMYTDNDMWKAYIDGKETEIIRANYLLRALQVSAGKHTILFECRPDSFYKGRWIAFGFGLITILILIVNYMFQKKRNSNSNT